LTALKMTIAILTC